MANDAFDTIIALSTPPGQGAIAILRMSGPEAPAIIGRLFAGKPLHEMAHAQLYHGHIVQRAEILDEVMAVWMRAPRSYTREHVVEIHCHGGSYAMSRILEACCAEGARMAEPGEFTKRAFLNGRLDLLQAEGVMDVIQAHSQWAAQASQSLMAGGLSQYIAPLKAQLLHTLAAVEVYLDYPEEELQEATHTAVRETLEAVSVGLSELLTHGAAARMVRNGVTVALAGRPNVGKSSLLNALSGRERAIVTDTPGTTRDVLEEWVQVQTAEQALSIRLLDTAGIRPATGVEAMGVERARQEQAGADVVLWVLDAAEGVTAEDETLAEELLLRIQAGQVIAVVNKQDIGTQLEEAQRFVADKAPRIPLVVVSALGDMDTLRQAIVQHVTNAHMAAALTEGRLVTHERHRAALTEAQAAIGQAQEALAVQPLDVVALDLQAGYDALAQLTGEQGAEAVIDHIFAAFCVGK